MFKIILKTLGALLLLGYLLSAGIIYGIGREEPRYRGVEIHIADSTQTQFLKSSDILKTIRANNIKIKGQTYTDVNTLQLSQIIEENKLVRYANCYHTPDSMLRIDVYQRQPVLRIKTSIHDCYIDREGEVMPYQRGTCSPRPLPLVTGVVNVEKSKADLYRLSQYLDVHRFWSEMITQFEMRSNGDLLFATRVGSATVLIGPIDDTFEDRMDCVRKFYDKVLPKTGWNAYKCINAKFNGRIYGEK